MTHTEEARAAPPAHRDFDSFFRSEFDRARRLAYLLTRSAEAAEDVAQDAMISVHRCFGRLDEPAAYLTRAVVNQCRSWHRRSARARRIQADLNTVSTQVVPADEEYLLDALHRLPERQRVVVVARFWGGHSEAEIARLLGCRPGTVKSLSSRALARLRKEFEL